MREGSPPPFPLSALRLLAHRASAEGRVAGLAQALASAEVWMRRKLTTAEVRAVTEALNLERGGRHVLASRKITVNKRVRQTSELLFKPGDTIIPRGVIVMWSGKLSAIPDGWALCDGTAGTPDLRAKFVKGAAAGMDPGGAGGAATHTHADHASHTHDVASQLATPDLFTGDLLATGVSGRTGGPSAALAHDTVNHEPSHIEVAYLMKL